MSDSLKEILSGGSEDKQETTAPPRSKGAPPSKQDHRAYRPKNLNIDNYRYKWLASTKIWVLRGMWAMPALCVYLIALAIDSGKFGVNSTFVALVFFGIHFACWIVLKNIGAEDYWNEDQSV